MPKAVEAEVTTACAEEAEDEAGPGRIGERTPEAEGRLPGGSKGRAGAALATGATCCAATGETPEEVVARATAGADAPEPVSSTRSLGGGDLLSGTWEDPDSDDVREGRKPATTINVTSRTSAKAPSRSLLFFTG